MADAEAERANVLLEEHFGHQPGDVDAVAVYSDPTGELTVDDPEFERAVTEALGRLPDDLDRAWSLDWSAAVRAFTPSSHLYVIARGVGLGIAQEAALKCKETCALHAEAFSSAEVRHGPQALLREKFPALVF